MMLLILVNLRLTVFSQTDTSKVQETVKCLTVSTFKKIAQDLLRGDSAIYELKLSDAQVIKLEEKLILKDSLINIFSEKEDNYKTIIYNHEQKLITLKKNNESIENQLKKEKTKNKLKSFFNKTIIGVLAVLLIFK